MTDISFNSFCDRRNGKPYTDGTPPPVGYELAQMDLQNVGGAELTPLSDDDMASRSREEILKDIDRMKKSGYNPTKVGEPMTDEELKKFYGQTW